MDSDFEVIDSFIDGHRVDAGELKDALANPDGRSYFVDAWLLREAVRGEAVSDEAPSSIPAISPGHLPRRARPWLVAAAFGGCLIGGYAIGRVTGPPAPATVAQPVTAVATTPAPAFPVPAPTQVIQLEFQNPPVTNGGD